MPNVSPAVVISACIAAVVARIACADTVVPEVLVHATRTVAVTVSHDSLTSSPITKTFTLSEGVGYKDLDLTSPVGVAELEKRVTTVAREVCLEIGKQYPDSKPDDAACAKAATKRAMAKVHELTLVAAKSH